MRSVLAIYRGDSLRWGAMIGVQVNLICFGGAREKRPLCWLLPPGPGPFQKTHSVQILLPSIEEGGNGGLTADI